MTPLIAIVLGIGLGLGVVMVLTAFLPARPQLAAALTRINDTTADKEIAPADTSLQHRVGGWLDRNIPQRSWLKVPESDLRLIGMSTEKYWYDKLLLAVTGFMAFPLLGLLSQAFGVIPFFIPALLGIPVGIALAMSVDSDVKKKAAEARAEFARAVAVYLELVAAERKRGATAARALETAANVGKSWVFVRIRQELNRARYAGVAPWDALHNLSVEIDIPDLDDVAKIVRLSGEDGASIYETLRARGKTLRHKLLSEEHEKANSDSERMQVPLAMSLFVYVGIIITPLMIRLLAP